MNNKCKTFWSDFFEVVWPNPQQDRPEPHATKGTQRGNSEAANTETTMDEETSGYLEICGDRRGLRTRLGSLGRQWRLLEQLRRWKNYKKKKLNKRTAQSSAKSEEKRLKASVPPLLRSHFSPVKKLNYQTQVPHAEYKPNKQWKSGE